MNFQPLHLSPARREQLAAYERLHEAWRVATETANRLDACCGNAGGAEARALLSQRLAADLLHRQALALVRSAPL